MGTSSWMIDGGFFGPPPPGIFFDTDGLPTKLPNYSPSMGEAAPVADPSYMVANKAGPRGR